MTLRIDEELDQALTELAEVEGTSRQEVVKRAVIERRDRAVHQAKVAEYADEFAVEYAGFMLRATELGL
jgi:predicted transcriptional regulator